MFFDSDQKLSPGGSLSHVGSRVIKPPTLPTGTGPLNTSNISFRQQRWPVSSKPDDKSNYGCSVVAMSHGGRSQSVRPNYHSLEINSIDDLVSPVPQFNKYRSASVGTRTPLEYDELINMMDEYIKKDLKQMDEDKIERESHQQTSSTSASRSSSVHSAHSPSVMYWEASSQHSMQQAPPATSPVAAVKSITASHPKHSAARTNITHSPRFSFSNLSQQSRSDYGTRAPVETFPGGSASSPIYQRHSGPHSMISPAAMFALSQKEASCLPTPQSADSVFTFDVPPKTPPVKVESTSSCAVGTSRLAQGQDTSLCKLKTSE